MKKSIKTILGGAILVALPMLLTSCEGTLDDVFGEWDKPSANTNTNPSSDPTPAVSNNYMAWNGTALAAEAIPTTGIQEVTNATTSFEGGFYIVKTDVTIPAPGILINADTKLILCDGATLTVNGYFEDQSSTTTYSLTIYGQENQTGKLIVNAPDGCCGTIVKDLEIHGGDINITGLTGLAAINPSGDISIYGGKVTATGGDADGIMPGGHGIVCGGNLTIKGQAIVKAYGGAESGTQNGGHGINVIKAIDISGSADVYAKSGKDADAAILAGLDLTFSGKQLVTEGTGNSAGLETVGMGGGSITISAGTVTLTTANGPTIQSDANVNISKCTLSATVATATSVIGAGTDVTIANDVTKVELTNSNATNNYCEEFIYCGGTLVTIGASAVPAGPWMSSKLITDFTTGGTAISGLSYDATPKILTYNPNNN